MAGSTRFELATSGVTGQRSNQLNYDPALICVTDINCYAQNGANRIPGA